MKSKRNISVKNIEELKENSICLNQVAFLRRTSEGKTEEVMLNNLEMQEKEAVYATTKDGMTTFITSIKTGKREHTERKPQMYVTFDPNARETLSVIGLKEVQQLYNPLTDKELTIKDPEIKKKIAHLRQQILERG